MQIERLNGQTYAYEGGEKSVLGNGFLEKGLAKVRVV